MKSQIVPVILFCIVFPWIVARVYQMEGPQDRLQEDCFESSDRSRTVPAVSSFAAEDQPVTYDELSTKQINYLIP